MVSARRTGDAAPAGGQPGRLGLGNAVLLVVRGAGQNWARKFATAFEGDPASAPRLVVTYSFAEASQPSLSIGDVSNQPKVTAVRRRRASR